MIQKQTNDFGCGWFRHMGICWSRTAIGQVSLLHCTTLQGTHFSVVDDVIAVVGML